MRSGGCRAAAVIRRVPLTSSPGTNADAVPAPARAAMGRRGASLPHGRTWERLPGWMVAIVTSGRDADGGRQDVRILGSEAAAGEGTASAFFGRGSTGGMAAAEADACPGTSSTRSRSGEACPCRKAERRTAAPRRPMVPSSPGFRGSAAGEEKKRVGSCRHHPGPAGLEQRGKKGRDSRLQRPTCPAPFPRVGAGKAPGKTRIRSPCRRRRRRPQ